MESEGSCWFWFFPRPLPPTPPAGIVSAGMQPEMRLQLCGRTPRGTVAEAMCSRFRLGAGLCGAQRGCRAACKASALPRCPPVGAGDGKRGLSSSRRSRCHR